MKIDLLHLVVKRLALLLLAEFCFSFGSSKAVSIVSDPSFSRAQYAPLAGALRVMTDVPSRVNVTVNDGFESWSRSFYDYAEVHSIPLFGFKPGRTNEIIVTVRDRFRNSASADAPVTFITDPLPAGFPVLHTLVSNPDRMEPGYTLFRPVNVNASVGYVTIVDNTGQVVWYSSHPTVSLDVKQLSDGNLFIPAGAKFSEVNLLGETVKTWNVPSTLSIDGHDGYPTDHDTFLYISDATRTIPDFPTSATDPNAATQSASVQFDRIIEFSATNGTVLNNWSLIDMLDPLRIGYLTFVKTTQGWDTEHGNAVIEDPRDNTIIVSSRTQNAVVKFFRDTGKVKWILGPHENWGPEFQQYLLKPVGTPFEWNYAQHAPTITPRGTLLLYDDGNFRASPFDSTVPDSENYSRAVEYDINEETMEVKQVWEYGGNISEPLYTGSVGNAQWLPKTGNILINFGNVSYVNHARPSAYSTNATMCRVKEVTHDDVPEVLFDLEVFDQENTTATYRGHWDYRSYRIPGLYGHLPAAVTDLNVRTDNGVAYLQFSGDPARTYAIEASADLKSWRDIGSPEAGDYGEYDFEDADSESAGYRYYRVVTR